jgi:hypothetical protein
MSVENPEGGNHSEDLDVKARIILKRIKEGRCESTKYIQLAQDKSPAVVKGGAY